MVFECQWQLVGTGLSVRLEVSILTDNDDLAYLRKNIGYDFWKNNGGGEGNTWQEGWCEGKK